MTNSTEIREIQIPNDPEFKYFDAVAARKVRQMGKTLATVGKVLKKHMEDLLYHRIQGGVVWL
jgi:hypothetical protein